MVGQLSANEMFVLVVGAILSFALQMFGAWLLYGMKQREKSRVAQLEEIREANKSLRRDLATLSSNHLELLKSHNDVVLYLKMKNGDIAREVL